MEPKPVFGPSLREPRPLYIQFTNFQEDNTWAQYGVHYSNVMRPAAKATLDKWLGNGQRELAYNAIKKWLTECLGEIVKIQYIEEGGYTMIDNRDRLALLTLTNMNLHLVVGGEDINNPYIDALTLIVLDPKDEVDMRLRGIERTTDLGSEPKPNWQLPLDDDRLIYIEFTK
jgi:hypothetical protein